MNGTSGLVGHEQNVFPLVLHARVRRSQVCLSKVDQIVLVLTDDRLTAGAIEMRLHSFSRSSDLGCRSLGRFHLLLVRPDLFQRPLVDHIGDGHM